MKETPQLDTNTTFCVMRPRAGVQAFCSMVSENIHFQPPETAESCSVTDGVLKSIHAPHPVPVSA